MTTRDLIEALKDATRDEMQEIRRLLKDEDDHPGNTDVMYYPKWAPRVDQMKERHK